jgi:DNA-binding transcriptional MerR regulator
MEDTRTPQEEIPDKLYFKIGEVSQIASVPTSVLRFWETEFKWIRPKRTPSGQRLYRRQEVEQILLIKDLLYNKKFTIKGAKRHLKSRDKTQPVSPNHLLDEIRNELEEIREILGEN